MSKNVDQMDETTGQRRKAIAAASPSHLRPPPPPPPPPPEIFLMEHASSSGITQDQHTEHLEISREESSADPLTAFTYKEMKKATKNFRPDSVLDGFGENVYKGLIDGGIREGMKPLRVAVKRHGRENNRIQERNREEWLAEVTFLGQLSHPNLVKLVGYCCENEYRMLIYEFMRRGSFESHLFSRELIPLPWSTRMRIAFGVAKGLAFLHEAENPLIYGNYDTFNILLDEDFNAKLPYFGFPKAGPVSHISGTTDYAPREYIDSGHSTTMCDVYSYGVVLLELLTGRKSFDRSRPDGERKLANWAFPQLPQKRKVLEIMDPRLDGNYPVKAVHEIAVLAYHCLNEYPRARPLMRDIVASLEPLQSPSVVPQIGPDLGPAEPMHAPRLAQKKTKTSPNCACVIA